MQIINVYFLNGKCGRIQHRQQYMAAVSSQHPGIFLLLLFVFTLLNLTYYIYMATTCQENSYSSMPGSVPGISQL